MRAVLTASGVFCLLVGQALSVCSPVDYTLYVEKPECGFCVAINTTICMGFCYSRDPNVVGLAVKRLAFQRACTYNVVEYRTAELPGCPPHVDPRFSYPVALRCTCKACDSVRDECTHRASGNADRCSKPLLLHVLAYPGQSNYIQSI